MDKRRHSPAAGRNKDLILTELKKTLPNDGTILEIGSGGGEHIAYYAEQFPSLTFQPSDRNSDYFDSIEAWCTERLNVNEPISLDLLQDETPVFKADGIICINVLHIAPAEAVYGLFHHASTILKTGAPLYLYGPYFRTDVETAASNLAFHEKLMRENPGGGIRQLEDVARTAKAHGFEGPMVTEMPANNLSVVFRKG